MNLPKYRVCQSIDTSEEAMNGATSHLVLTDDQCDRIAAIVMDKAATKMGCHALHLDPNIREHHHMRRGLLRTAYFIGAMEEKEKLRPALVIALQALELARQSSGWVRGLESVDDAIQIAQSALLQSPPEAI